MASKRPKCYMCDAAGDTREHVPPKSFFPRARRANIWSVPSCPAHNIDNSSDVEYVRNAICIHYGTNTAAEAFEVAQRSFDYSPALFNKTFRELKAIVVDNQEVGQFPFDLPRVKRVMNAVVHALAFRDFGREYIGEWRIFCATLRSSTDTPIERIAAWDSLRSLLKSAAFTPMAVPQPEVFSYGVHKMRGGGFIYRLVFYGGFVVYAWPVLKKRRPKGLTTAVVILGAVAGLLLLFSLYRSFRASGGA